MKSNSSPRRHRAERKTPLMKYASSLKELDGEFLKKIVRKGRDSSARNLKNAKGAWANDDWPETRKTRKKIELQEAKNRKEQW